jgi:hypothetical protein
MAETEGVRRQIIEQIESELVDKPVPVSRCLQDRELPQTQTQTQGQTRVPPRSPSADPHPKDHPRMKYPSKIRVTGDA